MVWAEFSRAGEKTEVTLLRERNLAVDWFCTEVAWRGRTEWATFEGSTALEARPPSSCSTWRENCQIPLGREGPTIGVLPWARCDTEELEWPGGAEENVNEEREEQGVLA